MAACNGDSNASAGAAPFSQSQAANIVTAGVPKPANLQNHNGLHHLFSILTECTCITNIYFPHDASVVVSISQLHLISN